MNIQNNVIKAYLKNVFFVTGTACGGKSTLSRALAERHDLLLFDIDRQFDRHKQLSDPAFQPSMNKTFPDADAFSAGVWRNTGNGCLPTPGNSWILCCWI